MASGEAIPTLRLSTLLKPTRVAPGGDGSVIGHGSGDSVFLAGARRIVWVANRDELQAGPTRIPKPVGDRRTCVPAMQTVRPGRGTI